MSLASHRVVVMHISALLYEALDRSRMFARGRDVSRSVTRLLDSGGPSAVDGGARREAGRECARKG